MTYTVPFLPLLEATYFVTVAAVNQADTEVFDYHDRAYSFRVVRQGGRFDEPFGLLTLAGEWAVRAAIEAAPEGSER